jgi:hypothetical protein
MKLARPPENICPDMAIGDANTRLQSAIALKLREDGLQQHRHDI